MQRLDFAALAHQSSANSSQQRSSTVLAAAVRSHCRAGAAVLFRGHRFPYWFAARPHALAEDYSKPRTSPAAVVRSHSCTLRSSCMYVYMYVNEHDNVVFNSIQLIISIYLSNCQRRNVHTLSYICMYVCKYIKRYSQPLPCRCSGSILQPSFHLPVRS